MTDTDWQHIAKRGLAKCTPEHTWAEWTAELHADLAALRSENEALTKALTDLRLTARVLLQNAEGCAVNHHGADFELHGPPGWLADCENVIAQAEAALQSPPLKEPNQ